VFVVADTLSFRITVIHPTPQIHLILSPHQTGHPTSKTHETTAKEEEKKKKNDESGESAEKLHTLYRDATTSRRWG
jgi:hypothetical protein